jgi:hypothetical protein
MEHGAISVDSESILLYLLNTRTGVERTLRAIRDACQLSDAKRAQRAIAELSDEGLVVDLGDNTFELSPSGSRYARKLHPDHQPRTVNNNLQQNITHMKGGSVIGFQDNTITPPQDGRSGNNIDETMRRLRHSLPNAASHPLRTLSGESQDIVVSQPVRFLLAFTVPKDVLPIPILHNDVLGRSRRANIRLNHDEHISAEHCRFEIKREQNSREFILYVEDLGSRNGTIVDDVEIKSGRHMLTHGSRIEIGSTVLIVVQIPY